MLRRAMRAAETSTIAHHAHDAPRRTRDRLMLMVAMSLEAQPRVGESRQRARPHDSRSSRSAAGETQVAGQVSRMQQRHVMAAQRRQRGHGRERAAPAGEQDPVGRSRRRARETAKARRSARQRRPAGSPRRAQSAETQAGACAESARWVPHADRGPSRTAPRRLKDLKRIEHLLLHCAALLETCGPRATHAATTQTKATGPAAHAVTRRYPSACPSCLRRAHGCRRGWPSWP